ncbi:uncharacterized protein N7459_002189 [Penicillium hispanicum]|uniref:uncharacterized protein n=1 Tax=Penicillium hispanicum TaxID=1080232 RepID=UPI0025406653|nr:uncharacterized protein N7459_002189 [Penicillium hispanicum]KAJ5591820.1 hypothetical protein N7459_002189 [Penicillium hispanicum]
MSSAKGDSGQTWTPGDFEHPNEELRQSVKIALVFAFFLSTLSVALRILARKMTGSKLLLDDYFILVALIAYSNTFVYMSCICFIKLSILALYKRLFSTRNMNIAVNAVGLFVIIWTVAIIVTGALQCIPINKYWDSSIQGSCMDTAKFYYGQQIPNILTDLVILLMPLKVVWGLPIGKSQKLLLSGVFLVGGLYASSSPCCRLQDANIYILRTMVFDIIRLWVIIRITKAGPDVTYNQAPMGVWTCDEAAVGIVAACLPNLRPLFKFGGGNFWSQIRSFSQRYGKGTIDTSSTAVSHGSISKPTESYIGDVSGDNIEIPQYRNYVKVEEK